MSESKKTENENEKDNVPSSPRRSRWIACVLYPDNIYHMEILDYLKNIGQTMVYIKHKPEFDEKKEHIHVMMHFDYPRTPSGFCSAFGMGKFLKSEDGYKPFPDNSNPNSFPVVELPILSHSEIVKSPADYFRYLLHQNFEAIKAGKTKYSISDMVFNGNENELRKLAYQEYQQFNNLINDLMCFSDCAKNAHDLIQILVDNDRFDLISYVQGHAYFIKEFFLHSEIKPKSKTTILDTIKGGE